jgi:hypothetical protein
MRRQWNPFFIAGHYFDPNIFETDVHLIRFKQCRDKKLWQNDVIGAPDSDALNLSKLQGFAFPFVSLAFFKTPGLGTFINSPVFRDTPSDANKPPHLEKCLPLSRKLETFTNHPSPPIHHQPRHSETTPCLHQYWGYSCMWPLS